MDLHHELKEFLSEAETGHSIFQLDHFVTIKEGLTPWGMYRQALRELKGRYNALRSLVIERIKAQQKIAKTKKPLKKVEWAFRLEETEERIAQNLRDFSRFFAHARHLKELIGDKDRDKLEADFWQERLKIKAAFEVMSTGRISESMSFLLLSLPKPMQETVSAFMVDPKSAAEYIDAIDVPEFKAVKVDILPQIEQEVQQAMIGYEPKEL